VRVCARVHQHEPLTKSAAAVLLPPDTLGSQVMDLFLPAFDEGYDDGSATGLCYWVAVPKELRARRVNRYLSDGRGQRHSCKQVVFVMTSNLGAGKLQEAILNSTTRSHPGGGGGDVAHDGAESSRVGSEVSGRFHILCGRFGWDLPTCCVFLS
jgi:hypothetical protein